MATINETIYLGRDNTISLILKSDGVAQDVSAVTRIVIKSQDDAFEIDSNISPAAFNWPTSTTGEIEMAFGNESIDACNWKKCWVIIFDATNDDGIIMNPNDDLVIQFIENA